MQTILWFSIINEIQHLDTSHRLSFFPSKSYRFDKAETTNLASLKFWIYDIILLKMFQCSSLKTILTRSELFIPLIIEIPEIVLILNSAFYYL